MRRQLIVLALLASAVTTQASAQTGAPIAAIKTFASSSDVASLIAKAKNDRKEGQPIVIETILALAPYKANLEYRASVGPAAIHETEAELFYVIDGKGTLVTGGKLIGEKRVNAENVNGTGIEGGSTTAVAKGDFLIVPQNTPHWFSTIDGTLIVMSLHVPRQ